MYYIDTAIQKHGKHEYKVTLFCDGEWRTSFHRSLESAREAVKELLTKYEGKIGR
jgi:hypothetical protein